jgi:hypothetical protein
VALRVTRAALRGLRVGLIMIGKLDRLSIPVNDLPFTLGDVFCYRFERWRPMQLGKRH